MVEFGEQLRKAREEKGMTQQTLADKLFVTRSTVSRWEHGERYPDLITTKKITEILDVSLDDLLSGKDMNKVVEKNSIVDNNFAEKLILAIYAIFLTLCLRLVYLDAFRIGFKASDSDFSHLLVDSSLKENITWNIMPKILFFALTFILVYGFIRAAKGTLSPKIIGIIGIITFATSSLMNAAQIITENIMQSVIVNLSKNDYTIDIMNSVIKPNFIHLIITLIPAVIGVITAFIYFIHKNNNVLWLILFILMTVLEIVMSFKFIMYWQKTASRLPNYMQFDFFVQLNTQGGLNLDKYIFYIAVYVFLLFQAVALWIKKAKVKNTPEANTTQNAEVS